MRTSSTGRASRTRAASASRVTSACGGTLRRWAAPRRDWSGNTRSPGRRKARTHRSSTTAGRSAWCCAPAQMSSRCLSHRGTGRPSTPRASWCCAVPRVTGCPRRSAPRIKWRGLSDRLPACPSLLHNNMHREPLQWLDVLFPGPVVNQFQRRLPDLHGAELQLLYSARAHPVRVGLEARLAKLLEHRLPADSLPPVAGRRVRDKLDDEPLPLG